jgi:hypothetical protein
MINTVASIMRKITEDSFAKTEVFIPLSEPVPAVLPDPPVALDEESDDGE